MWREITTTRRTVKRTLSPRRRDGNRRQIRASCPRGCRTRRCPIGGHVVRGCVAREIGEKRGRNIGCGRRILRVGAHDGSSSATLRMRDISSSRNKRRDACGLRVDSLGEISTAWLRIGFM